VHDHHWKGHFKCSVEKCDFVATTRHEIHKHQNEAHHGKVMAEPANKLDLAESVNDEEIGAQIYPLKKYRCIECAKVIEDKRNAIKHVRRVHFKLPATIKEQIEKGIKDNRNAKDCIEPITIYVCKY